VIPFGPHDRREDFPLLDAARQLAAEARQAEEEISAERQLPRSLAANLKAAGMFRLLLPRAFGGEELDLPSYLRIVEVFGEGDGSTGWCVNQGAVYASLAPLMHPDLAEAIWSDPDAVVATGVPKRMDTHELADGRFAVSGHWRFASGAMHATWLSAQSAVRGARGEPSAHRMFLVPRAAAEFCGGWDVRGMRGTGSFEYTLDGVEVPAEHSLRSSEVGRFCGATGVPLQLLFASGFGAVGLGLARRALTALAEIAAGKVPVFTQTRLREDELVQTGIGQCEALYGATRAYLIDSAEECAHINGRGEDVPMAVRARLRLAATHAMQSAGEIVNRVYRLAGTDGMFEGHPLQRCFQDVNALTQQVQGRTAHYRTVGRMLLGLEPDSTFV